MKKQRLVWVDLAKAFVIILMIIGHVVPFKSTLYVLIFSFHMPFFFIISGYTSREVSTLKQLLIYIKKLAKRILVPTILITYLASFELIHSISEVPLAFSQASKELFWGGAPPQNTHLSVELIWFLIVFFFAKLLYEGLTITFNEKSKFILLLILAFSTYVFISRHFYLPFALDLVPLASLYMCIGHILSLKRKAAERYYYVVMGFAFVYWTYMVELGTFIDMSNRNFTNQWSLAVLETIAGTFVIMGLAKACGNGRLISVFSLIGRHTLLIMFVHLLDMYSQWHLSLNIYSIAIIRVFVDVGITLAIVWIMQLVKRKVRE